MNKLYITGLLTLGILLSACGGLNPKKVEKPEPIKPTVLAEYVGIWELKGTGNIWTIDDNNFTSYNVNSYGCVKTDDMELSHIEEAIAYLTINNDKTQMTFDHGASNPYSFTTLNQLPEHCQVANILAETNLETNFEYIWHTMNDYYAFFDTRNINWQTVYNEYRPLITPSTSNSEFFEIMDDIFSAFGDGHLGLSDNQGKKISGIALNGFTAEVFRSVIVDAGDDYGQAWQELENYNELVLSRLLQDNALHSHQNSDAIRWGKLTDTVGYIRIDRVQNININGEKEESDNLTETLAGISQDIIDTDTIMQEALSDIGDSEALIIDLRFNGGGFDNISLKIASYFSEEAQVIGSKKINNRNFQSDVHELKLTSSPTTAFTKPIYVITGRSTGSGGEVLSMALKALPQVTMIGEPTNGSVSDILEHTLPNGWNLSLSNEVYTDKQGQNIESIGVTPDVEMPVYATQDVIYYSNTPIDYALQQLGEISNATPNENDIVQAFEQYFKPTNVPGIAVAIIKNDEIVYSKAYGLANIDDDISVTMDTPFNVGSISKSILATGIMQQVEQGNIHLDDKLTQMNLTFDPNNPLNEDEGITIRHLVTHTSGIRDSDGYGCSYYLHENNKSLYQMFGVDYCPEDATSDPATFFANDYFNVNGRYVMDGIHNDGEDGFPGMDHEYSNVGAGLAAYAIEQKLNIDFAEVMQQNIFIPLNMHNTAWRHTQLNANNAKAVQYALDDDLQPIQVPEYSYPTFYDGDLNISANDLAKFLITITNAGEYQGTRILQPVTVEAMVDSQTEVLNQSDKQGVFWYWQGSYVGHGGGDPGTNAMMQYNTATKTGIVVLMNGEDDHLGEGEVDDMLMPLMSILYRYGLGQ